MQTRRRTGRADVQCAGLRLTLQWLSALRSLALSLFLAGFAVLAVAGSNVVEYTYDAAGNIVQIARQTVAGLAITSFDPTSGPVGTAVTIYGSGFDAAPANNIVKFNGIVATVTASASGSISTTVPSGATTGPISITVSASTVMSSQPFTVTVPGAPTITGFAPGSGPASTSVAVTGTAFDTAANATTVKLNGVTAAASVASDTSLSFTVPASAASGKITATTAAGVGASASDFIVPPAGVNAADIVATARVTPGGASANIAVPTVSKYGLVLFDAQPNVYYSVQFGAVAVSPTTATVSYQLIKPDNTVLQSGAITGASNRPTIHLPLLATAGTYSILLSPGSATLNTNVRVEINPVTTVDGPAIASSLDFNYQSARFVFNVGAQEHVGVGILGVAFTPNTGTTSVGVRVLQADGTQLASNTCYANQFGNPQNNCDTEFMAPAAGSYTLVMDSPATSFGNASVQVTGELAGTLAPDVSQAVNLARVGQDARYTFSATAGDSLAVDVSGASMQPQAQRVQLIILKPDGTYLTSCSATAPSPLYCELGGLATAGTYTAFLDPDFGAYGTFALTLKQGALLQPTDPPTSFSASASSETMRFRFTGAAGQNSSIGLAGLAYDAGAGPTYPTVYAPNGSSVGAAGNCNPVGTAGGYCRLTMSKLPQSGTYSVVLKPPAGVKISGNVTLSNDVSGTLVAGTPQTVDASRQGQLARFTFAASAGDSISVKLNGLSTTPAGRSVALIVNRPDGSYFNSMTVGPTPTWSAGLLNLPSLPVSGSYTAVVDPSTGGTWQGSLLLDPGTPIVVDAAPFTPTAANPGETARYTLGLTAGQRVDFGMTGLACGQSGTCSANVALYSPSGSSVMSASCSASSAGCDATLASAPATGTYSLLVAPPAGNTIAGGSLALSTPIAGTLNIGDPSQTIAIDRPGQTARYTFSGASGQALRLNWTSAVVSGNTYVYVSVYKPDGGLLNSSSFPNGANGGLDLLALPVSGTYTVLLDPAFGQSMSALISLVTR